MKGKTVTRYLVYTPAPLLVGSKSTEGMFWSSFKGLVNATFSMVPQACQVATVINIDSHSYTALLVA